MTLEVKSAHHSKKGIKENLEMVPTEESNIKRIFLKRSPYLFKKYEGIRTELESTLERISDRYYSEHGLAHCDNILRNIDSIVPSEIKQGMGENELFCLSCSILLHDIGRIKQNVPNEPFNETNRDHARRSYDWITENGGRSLGLDMPYIKPVAWICWGHGDAEEVENVIRSTFNGCMIPIENEEIDILFLISLLRLGDVLDMGFRRIPKHAIDSLWKIPDSEIKFILKDYLTNAVIINSDEWRIEVTLRKPSNIDDTLFSEIETDLIKNKCEEVLNSVTEHLNRRGIRFRSIDIQTIEVEPEEIIDKLLNKQITKRTYGEMTEEYKMAKKITPGERIPAYPKPDKERKSKSITMSSSIFDGKGENVVISKPKTNRKEAI